MGFAKKSLAAVVTTVLAASVHKTNAANIVDLGTLGGNESYAYDINESGQIVGWSRTANGHGRAFLYSAGSMINLGTIGDTTDSAAYGINNAGQIVGDYAYVNGRVRSFLYSGGAMTDIDPATIGGDDLETRDITDAGQIMGRIRTVSPDVVRGFVYDGTTVQTLGPLGGSTYSSGWSHAYAINNAGQVVGASNVAGLYTDIHAVIWDPAGNVLDLGTLGGPNSWAYEINASGQVVGSANTGDELFGRPVEHPFLFDGTSMIDLGTLPGTWGAALDINDNGDVIGYTYFPFTPDLGDGFIYRNGVLTNLMSLLPSGTGWSGLVPEAINNKGQIAGFGTRNGETRAFLIDLNAETPAAVPAPTAAAGGLALLGGLATLNRRRRVA